MKYSYRTSGFNDFLSRLQSQQVFDNVNLADFMQPGSVPFSSLYLEAGQIADKINASEITSTMLADAAVTTAKLANLAVDNDKLAALAVDAAKLADSAVESTKIANAAVGNAAIAALAVGTAHIANGAITNAKINDLDAGKINAGTISADRISTTTLVGKTITAGTCMLGAVGGHSGLSLNGTTDYNNIFFKRDSDGVVFFRLNNGGSHYITFNSSSGTLSIGGNIQMKSGSTLSADYITAGTLTGRTVQSTSGGNRIRLTNGDLLEFYYGGSRQAYVRADGAGDFHVVANDDVVFNAGNGDRCGVYSGAFKPIADNVYDLGALNKRWDHLYATYGKFADVTIDGSSIYPSSASGHHCGTSSHHWGEVYTNGCTGCAYKEFNLLTEEQKKRHKKKNKIDDYEIGQVLVIKKDKEELVPCNCDACDCVIGVGSDNGVPIVLGAEPVQVSGKIKKGQRLVTSMAFGRARGLKEGEKVKSGAIFARALESKNTEGNGIIKAFINITN